MCYAEFNDILPQIAAMDADVITIETSRSDMELLNGFGQFRYPNEIGPGVYDIHSPRVPGQAEMVRLLRKASAVIPAGQSLGQSGLRPEDARVGGDGDGAAQYGGGRAPIARRARHLLRATDIGITVETRRAD